MFDFDGGKCITETYFKNVSNEQHFHLPKKKKVNIEDYVISCRHSLL